MTTAPKLNKFSFNEKKNQQICTTTRVMGYIQNSLFYINITLLFSRLSRHYVYAIACNKLLHYLRTGDNEFIYLTVFLVFTSKIINDSHQ